MRRKKLIIFGCLSLVLVLLGATLYRSRSYFHSKAFLRALPATVRSQLSDTFDLSPTKVIDESGRNIQFSISPNFTQINYFQFLVGSPIQNNEIVVTITTDASYAATKFFYSNSLVSGFKVLPTTTQTTIYIYLSPEITDHDKLGYELTRNYLAAVVIASEYAKLQLDSSYSPKYDAAEVLAGDIAIDAADSKRYPVALQ